MDASCNQGQKPHCVRVKLGGGIDGGCKGKNEFDEQLRTLVPRILNVSCVSRKDQHPHSVGKLRSALEASIEYVGTNLSNKKRGEEAHEDGEVKNKWMVSWWEERMSRYH